MSQINNQAMSIEQMVNIAEYPISDDQTNNYLELANRCRQQYVETGLCELPNFILPDALSVLAEEANHFSSRAYFCQNTHNAYLTADDGDLPDNTAHQHQEKTYVGSVAYDQIPEDSNLKQLYLWDPLKDFIGAVLGKAHISSFCRSFWCLFYQRLRRWRRAWLAF